MSFLECNFPHHRHLFFLLTFLTLKLPTSHCDLSSSSSATSTRLIALGRDASLGSFYDIALDNFAPLWVNMFKSEGSTPPSFALELDKSSKFSWSRYNIMNMSSDILSNFEASNDLKLNLLLGLTKVTERGKYLNWTLEKNHRTVMGIVTFVFGTEYESLKLEPEKTRRLLSPLVQFPIKTAKDDKGLAFSHVVLGVQYGAVVCIKLQQKIFTTDLDQQRLLSSWPEGSEENYEMEFLKRKNKMEAQLKIQMKYLTAKTKSVLMLEKYFASNPSAINFDVEIAGDLMEEGGDGKIQNVFTALNFLKKVPQSLGKINGGRGHPISFDVVQINDVINSFLLDQQPPKQPDLLFSQTILM